MLVEDLPSNLVDERVCDPGPVVPVGDFAQLVRAHLLHRNLIRLVIALDRDLSGHSTHGGNFSSEKVSQYDPFQKDRGFHLLTCGRSG